MRILILGINYWPEETGIGAFTTYRAEYLASVGHDVTVCTSFPYYPEWVVSRHYVGKIWASEERNGVNILRSIAYIPNPPNGLKRIVHEASFIISSLLRAMSARRPDLLLVASPPLGLAVTAILLSRLWKIPYVFDVEDLQPDAAGAMGMLPPWAVRLMYRVERMAYRHAALVSTLTNGMRHRIIAKGVPLEKTVVFEPRADESLSGISPNEGARFREEFNLGQKFIVTHSGNVGVKQGLEVILDTAVMCRGDDEMLFLIVGDGAAREQIQRRTAALKLENVRFLPLLESLTFRGLLSASNICLVTQRKSVSDIVFPSKTVTYLAAGCPVIASVNSDSEVAQTVRDSGAGLVVEPEDPGALLTAIYELRRGDLDARARHAGDYATRRWSAARVLGSFEATLVAVAAPVHESLPAGS